MEEIILAEAERLSSGLYEKVSVYLDPFSNLLSLEEARKTKSKSKKNTLLDPQHVRSLAKDYLSFLSRLIKIARDRLSKDRDTMSLEAVDELFRVYKLALDCLMCLSSCIMGQQCSILPLRVRLLRYLERWGRYKEARECGNELLLKLKDVLGPETKGRKPKCSKALCLLPKLRPEIADVDMASSIAEIVLSLIICTHKSKAEDPSAYHHILSLFDEVQPWLGVLAPNQFDKFGRAIVGALKNCSMVLAKSTCFDKDIIHRFCMTVLDGYLSWYTKSQCLKVACDLCSLLDWSRMEALVLDILKCCLGFVCQSKMDVTGIVDEFFDFLFYFCCKCRDSSSFLRVAASSYLIDFINSSISTFSFVATILKIYAGGLCSIEDGSDRILKELASSLVGNEVGNALNSLAANMENTSLMCNHEHRKISSQCYIHALGFLCMPYSECINTTWKHIILDNDDIPFFSEIDVVHDILFLFCNGFLAEFSATCGNGTNKLNESRVTFFRVAMSVLRISLRVNREVQKSTTLIDQIILTDWIQPQELEFLAKSTRNIALALLKNKQVDKASTSLKLSCAASWAQTSLLCQNRCGANLVHGDNTLDAMITETACSAYTNTALLLDALHNSGYSEMKEIMSAALLNWSTARNLHRLQAPSVLVKQWVKIMFKDASYARGKDTPTSLYFVLPSSCEKTTVGLLLEEEILAYVDMETRNPSFSQMMQSKIISILLQNIYDNEVYCLQRSKVLLWKGRLLREASIDDLNSCIQCLSEAILLLEDLLNKPSDEVSSIHHLLASSYCLRAIFVHELDQNLEAILNDISCALKLWSSREKNNQFSSDPSSGPEYWKAVPLLCHTTDLLALRGCSDTQLDVIKIIISLCNSNILANKCLQILWTGKRLCHPLCFSPIGEAYLHYLAQQYGKEAFSVCYWFNSIEAHEPSLRLEFCQKLLVCCAKQFAGDVNYPNDSFNLDLSVQRIKEVTSAIVSRVPLSIQDAFLAGCLNYDLSDRLISCGKLFEALSAAKEALRLRKRSLYRKFNFVSGCQSQKNGSMAETSCSKTNEQPFCCISKIITEIWPGTTKLENLDGCILSPWLILRCFLESCLQVGFIQESIGNGADAESILLHGKQLSFSVGLPLFGVAFSCLLGKIYRKKQLWSLAESELEIAKKTLHMSNAFFSCKHCKIIWEVTLDLHSGDLHKKQVKFVTSNRSLSNQANAVDTYTSALQKLGHSEYRLLQESEPFSHGKTSVPVRKRGSEASHNLKVIHPATSSDFHQIFNTTDQDPSKCFEVMPLSMEEIVAFVWDFHCRRISIKLLHRIVKCKKAAAEVHEVHEIFLEYMSLFRRVPLSQIAFDAWNLLHAGLDYWGGMLVVEYATFFYDFSLFSLRTRFANKARCCGQFDIEMTHIVSWLLHSFILSHQLPHLISKVARLLSVIFVLSKEASDVLMHVCYGNPLSSNHWALYFHQVSIGTYLQQYHVSCSREQSNIPIPIENSGTGDSARHGHESCSRFRYAPSQLDDLGDVVCSFFADLPNATVVCMSLLGGSYKNLLVDMLKFTPHVSGWLFLSRVCPDRKPSSLFMPVNLIVEEDKEVDSNDEVGDDDAVEYVSLLGHSEPKWECCWGYTLLDDVVPQFRSIIEQNHFTTSNVFDLDAPNCRSSWWKRRNKLNDQLGNLLRKLEDTWLGPWRCLLLGECLDTGCLDRAVARLSNTLSNFKFQAHEHLLRTVLGGAISSADAVECFVQLLCTEGSVGTSVVCSQHEWCLGSSNNVRTDAAEILCSSVKNAFIEVAENDLERKPVILVMDANIQMFPWESLPVLRKQEVYRIPSLGLIRKILRQHQIEKSFDIFPSVDMSNAYFVLNPSGDLLSTQLQFEELFKSRKWKGQIGTAPTVDELVQALEMHDLFLYLGHGSGAQYIPSHEVQKLDRCSACFLMGCSSGSLYLNHSYAPRGVPISYLLAGSPAIFCNLWDVTDKDIDRFSGAIIDSWLKEAYTTRTACNCIHVDFSGLSINGKRCRKIGKRKSKDKFEKCCSSCKGVNTCRKNRLASFIGQSREACKLPVLVGAAVVCYGLPTTILKKEAS